MCGLAGEVCRDGAPDMAALERMSAVLAPRGPDGLGSFCHEGVGLVHRRLKVIDLSPHGDQPMVDEQRGLAIVFNGCIYNHHELRTELQRSGQSFRSSSDTEVILAAYQQWGPDHFLERLIGMFAFALVETTPGGRVMLVRDRLGIKPLYLAERGASLVFASTLPALLAGGGLDDDLDVGALHHYLSFHSVVPAPLTILKGVSKLEPATILTIEADGSRHRRRYWEASFSVDASCTRSAAEWGDEVLESLRTAVRRRMVADVPVGVLLSGGLDSSLIVALLAEQGQEALSTYSIGFSSGGGRAGNEFEYSDRVAQTFATDHHRIEIDDRELVGSLKGAVRAMSEPMVSHDVVAFYLLSREVSRDLKVVQSGQGADEVFAGYSWYPPMSEAHGLGDGRYAQVFIDRPHTEIVKELRARYRSGNDVSHAFVREHFERAGAVDALNRALRLDTEVMLVEDPVKRLDNMTMAWGLEARTPFLDHELVELAASCPAEHKLMRGGKGVLKQAADGLLDGALIDRRKGYFPVPLLSHLQGEALELVSDTLRSRAAVDRGVFDRSYVDRLLASPNEQQTRLEGNRLWQLALLEMWLQEQGIG